MPSMICPDIFHHILTQDPCCFMGIYADSVRTNEEPEPAFQAKTLMGKGSLRMLFLLFVHTSLLSDWPKKMVAMQRFKG